VVGTFEGDVQDPLRAGQLLGLVDCDVPKKGVEGREAHIAGGHSVVACVFQVIQEGHHVLSFDIGEI
jgi:hypothetical protein